MTDVPTSPTDAHPDDSERDGMLNDIGTRWSRFTRRELAELASDDELVSQVVAKYGIERIAARREVDALLAGRRLTA
jgi:hypothetical protein